MTASIRKLALTAHVTSSAGWLGGVAAFLTLAIAGQATYEPEVLRGFYLGLSLIGWYIIVPLCLASLATGLITSLRTKWGLFQHYWVTIKFLLTVVSTLILFGFTQTLTQMGAVSETSAPVVGMSDFGQSPVWHAAGGLLVFVFNTTLSVFKPLGRTPLAGDKQQVDGTGVSEERRIAPYFIFGLIGLVIVFLIVHLISRGGH